MRSRLNVIVPLLVMAAIGLGLAYIGQRVSSLDHDLDESKADRANLRALLNEQESASQTLAEQVRQLGGKPAIEPGKPTPGPAGPAPTEAQVRAAVATYCGTGNRCKPTVSRSQIDEAVADFCAKGACIGDRGRDGKDGVGLDGKDGSTGPQGPGPTSDQIATAVAAYCGGGKCTGAPGAPGAPGKDGKDATFTEAGKTCDTGQRVDSVWLRANGSLEVTCAPLVEVP